MGDSGVRLSFQAEVSPGLNGKIRSLYHLCQQENWPGVVEGVPSYGALTIYYRPDVITYEDMCAHLSVLVDANLQKDTERSETVWIPVLYGGEGGKDLARIAEANGFTIDDVIAIHSGRDYLIYMMGFLPGFPYLGGMPASIATPRLDTPRRHVPAGAVGIAGGQTGIYPLASPGGWNLIGQTPLKLFDVHRTPPFLYQAGDYVRFVPVDQKAYERIRVADEQNRYELKREAAD